MPKVNGSCSIGQYRCLNALGLIQAMDAATTVEELQRIKFKFDAADTAAADSTEVMLAIKEALHPTDGSHREAHFDNLSAVALKRILKNRFTDLYKDREKALLLGGDQQSSSSSGGPHTMIGLLI